jgi:fluoride exporter
MSFMTLSIAGAVGAVCRYAISGWIQTRHQSGFPLGTLVVNIAGSFGLGLALGFGALESLPVLAAIGFLGGFTTFSTWMIESLGLGLPSMRAALNLALSLLGGVLAVVAGFMLTS